MAHQLEFTHHFRSFEVGKATAQPRFGGLRWHQVLTALALRRWRDDHVGHGEMRADFCVARDMPWDGVKIDAQRLRRLKAFKHTAINP